MLITALVYVPSCPYHHTWYSDVQWLNTTELNYLYQYLQLVRWHLLAPCQLPTPQLSDPLLKPKPTAVTVTASYHDSRPTSNNNSLVFNSFVFYSKTSHTDYNTAYPHESFSRRQNCFHAALNPNVNGVSWHTPITLTQTQCILCLCNKCNQENDSKAFFNVQLCTRGFKRGEVAYRRMMFWPTPVSASTAFSMT